MSLFLIVWTNYIQLTHTRSALPEAGCDWTGAQYGQKFVHDRSAASHMEACQTRQPHH